MSAKLLSPRKLPDLPVYGSTTDAYHRELRRALDRDDSRAINQALNIPAFRVHRNGSDQTGIATATHTRIAFTTAAIDTHTYFDVTTNYRYTPKIAGVYFFAVRAMWNYAFAAVNTHIIQVYQNGNTAAVGQTVYSAGGTGPTMYADTILTMNGSTDYVDFFCFQDSGSSRPLLGTATYTYAYGHKVCD